jgi:hypothetical protein
MMLIIMKWIKSTNSESTQQPSNKVSEHYQSNSPQTQNDNENYILGNFFLKENSSGYDEYNAYKKDPNVQPIQFPPIDYEHKFVSGLKESNPIFAVPQENVTFVNLLNP